jgi:SGNH hydrolase-like domain, acetyltransferase AlgX
VVFRFLPVSDYTYPQPVNDKSPVAKLLPNREMMFSKGWKFLYRNKVRINNDGFINDLDYHVDDKEPLVAIVGDSYIEALMVPYTATLQGILAREFRGKLRIYSFGFSGAPLSQYLAWARYAKQKYQNDFLIINVVANDFDESLVKYKNLAGGHYYRPDANGDLQMTRVDYMFTKYRFLLKSAFMRYLLVNLQATHVVDNIRALLSAKQQYVGNVGAVASIDMINESKKAISAFFRDLPVYSGLPNNRVLLIIDAMRPSMYDEQELQRAHESYYDQMRREFMSRAAAVGYTVLDMQRPFMEHYKVNNAKFEFPEDGHWNALGHRLAAENIMRNKLFKLFLQSALETESDRALRG